MRAVFFGTPEWAVPSLQATLASEIEIVAVVTNPDRPAGRGYELKPPPVKVEASAHGLEVLQPERASDEGFLAELGALRPDVCLVVAYGKILPATVLQVPPLGFVNLHFSLLPEYRGAAPVQRAVMEGRSSTGVTIMRLTEGMDEGPVLAMQEVAIEEGETAGDLGLRLAEIGAPLLVETLLGLGAGEIEERPQDHSQATYAPKISNDEARIDWELDARDIANIVRGLNPVPGAWTELRGARLKVHLATPLEGNGEPGTVIGLDPEGPVVAAGTGALRLDSVQPAGKKRMTGADLARGTRLAVGDGLGN